MASWEDTKRAAQTTIGNIFHDAYLSIGNAYQQVLTTGRIYPDASSLTTDIATGAYEPTPEDWQEYGRYVDAYNRDNPDPRLSDPGLEPER